MMDLSNISVNKQSSIRIAGSKILYFDPFEVQTAMQDAALIPIGGHYTMDKQQAAAYICQLQPAAVIPTHYGDIVGSPSDGTEFMELVKSGNCGIQVELRLFS